MNLPSTIVTLLCSALLLPVVKAGNSTVARERIIVRPAVAPKVETSSTEFKTNLLYDSLDLGALGLNKQALLHAYKGMEKLAGKGRLNEPDILTICDFSQSSKRKRLYIIDVTNFKVLMNTYVAHGKNSGLEYAQRFSNRIKSHQSSLGFYITRNTYHGKHGLSLKLTGLEAGFNDKAEARALVVHGANYIGPSRSGTTNIGRSYGCPAVPRKDAARMIDLIKDGSCLFIYHPSKTYLKGSKILNM